MAPWLSLVTMVGSTLLMAASYVRSVGLATRVSLWLLMSKAEERDLLNRSGNAYAECASQAGFLLVANQGDSAWPPALQRRARMPVSFGLGPSFRCPRRRIVLSFRHPVHTPPTGDAHDMTSNYFQRWTSAYRTEFWHDSAEPAEIRRAASWGATGVTTNPVLMPRAARNSTARWDVEIAAWKRSSPMPSIEEIGWAIMRGIAQEAAAILRPVYDRTGGQKGSICVQVDPTKHGDAEAMVEQAEVVTTWAPNLLIKLPMTAAGLVALEECAARGISTTATVSFTVPQVLRVGDAYRRGLGRARRAGVDVSRTHSYAVIMIGRLDSHLRDVVQEQGLDVSEAAIRLSGEAVAKRAASAFRERKYESVLCFSSVRDYHDPGVVIGGPHVFTIPRSLEDQILREQTPLDSGIDEPVPQATIDELRRIPDFGRAYDDDGMSPDEFAGYGPVVKTLDEFLAGYADMMAFVRERLATM